MSWRKSRENGSVSICDEVIERLRTYDGHTDTLRLAGDAAFFSRVVAALAEPFAREHVTKVVGVEARGFVFATAVALRLGAGFVPVRKPGSIHPGPKAELVSGPSWRGEPLTLRVAREHLQADDRALLVDDWAETGSQALAARALVEECGATYVGLSLLVDQLDEATRARLAPVVFILRHDEVPQG
jgi:adenine phosphoribosyltransferase